MILGGTDRAAGVGIHAGWAFTFEAGSTSVTVTSDSHDAAIEATLPGGLEGGSYTIAIDGLSEVDHLALTTGARSDEAHTARLYLFWYDTTSGVGEYLANVAGVTSLVANEAEPPADRLVAVLSVVEVSRRPGRARYQTVVTARELVFERLGRRVPAESDPQAQPPTTPYAAVARAAGAVDVPLSEHPAPGAVDEAFTGDELAKLMRAAATLTPGARYRTEIADVARTLAEATGRHGRGVLLIRDGTLHVGVREGQLGGGDPLPLTPSVGLVEVVSAGRRGGGAGVAPRDAWRLVLKGRPDLKPGAVVAFARPPQEGPPSRAAAIGQAIAGSLGVAGPFLPGLTDELGDDPVLLYVEGVSHALSRTAAFVTTVTGVEVSGAAAADDIYDPAPEAADEDGADTGGAADAAGVAARAVRAQVRRALGRVRHLSGGEVRRVTADGDGSADVPPRHTETVWRGLVDPDGRPNRIARLPLRRTSPQVRERVPRLTPFAWGLTGLVLPRYPGTRVVLGHGQGREDDPVDVGAVWPAGAGPDSQPGDWWLSLPVGVDPAGRTSLPDTTDEPDAHTGDVTHDLIDADGNRVIEVGELTIRVGRDLLGPAGSRPVRPSQEDTAPGEGSKPADAVTIEHGDAGSRIVMTADGTIRISGSRIELDAGDGEIAMTAATVDVTVSQTMDVSQG